MVNVLSSGILSSNNSLTNAFNISQSLFTRRLHLGGRSVQYCWADSFIHGAWPLPLASERAQRALVGSRAVWLGLAHNNPPHVAVWGRCSVVIVCSSVHVRCTYHRLTCSYITHMGSMKNAPCRDRCRGCSMCAPQSALHARVWFRVHSTPTYNHCIL